MSWLMPTPIMGEADAIHNGQVVLAYYATAAGSGPNVSVNNFSFAATVGSSATSTFSAAPISTSGTTGTFAGLTGSYQTILSYALNATGSGGATATYTGLTQGDTYQVQIWVNYASGSTYNGDSETVSDTTSGAIASSNVFFSSNNGSNGNVGSSIIGTFVADSTGKETIKFTPTGLDKIVIANAFTLSNVSVPEPSSIAMMGIGCFAGLGVLARRRLSNPVRSL